MVKSRVIPLLLLGALSLSGCPDGTPGKETVKNKWQDMLDELKKMDEASMKKHWKRYYQAAIEDLEKSVAELNKQKLNVMVEKEKHSEDLDKLKPKAEATKAFIKKALKEYQDSVAAKSEEISMNNERYKPEEARRQLVRWKNEFEIKYSKKKLEHKIELVKKLTDTLGRIDIAMQTYREKIEDLKMQMETYEAELDVIKVKESMSALCNTGMEGIGSSEVPSLKQLDGLNKSLDKAILTAKAKEKMADQETALKKKFSSLDEAVGKVGADLPDAEKDKDLAEIAKLQ